jgi:hypothetical protein
MGPEAWGLADTLAGVAGGAAVTLVVAWLTVRHADRSAAHDREANALRDVQPALSAARDETFRLIGFMLEPATDFDNQAAGLAAEAYFRTTRDAFDRASNLPDGKLRDQARQFSFFALARLVLFASDTAQGTRKQEDLQAELDAVDRDLSELRIAISGRLSAMSGRATV